jgi:hypothetical protein
MKKFAILILALICVNVVMAQPRALSGPPRPTLLNINDTQGNTNIRNSNPNGAPIAPATLLLLGLGGAAVGAKVIRNTKKGGE